MLKNSTAHPGLKVARSELDELLFEHDRRSRGAGGGRKAAKQRIQEHYLWPKIAQEIEKTYLEMMDRPGAVPAATTMPASALVQAAEDGKHPAAAIVPMPVPESTHSAA